MSVKLSWANKAESVWSYHDGKWIETVKYQRPRDPDEIYEEKVLKDMKEQGKLPPPK